MRRLTIFPANTTAGAELVAKVYELCVSEGYQVQIASQATQADFILACLRDDVVVVDASIEDGLGAVYPIMTENPKSLDHVLVVSRTYLPINFFGLRGGGAPPYPYPYGAPKGKDASFRWTNVEIVGWLKEQIEDLKANDLYPRVQINDVSELQQGIPALYTMMEKSLERQRLRRRKSDQIFISYRSLDYERVNEFKGEIEGKRLPVELNNPVVKILDPGELTFENEVLSPMRRWSVMSLLDDLLRDSTELWVYRTENYAKSWWTLGELVCASYINQSERLNDPAPPLRIRVYDAKTESLAPDDSFNVRLAEPQIKRLSRLFSNTRPDAMGPENVFREGMMGALLEAGLGDDFREFAASLFGDPEFRGLMESMLPPSISAEDKAEMFDYMQSIYRDPKALEAYTNDSVFSEEFWTIPSVQTSAPEIYSPERGVDVDKFLKTPEDEMIREVSMEQLAEAAETGGLIRLNNGAEFSVKKLPPRYLWKPVRFGFDTGVDAPALEAMPTYILTEPDPKK